MQKERLELGGAAIVEKQRRKASPGVERKHRQVSLYKRKRRPSMVNEEEHVDIDEPWSQSYVHISQDIISDDDTRSLYCCSSLLQGSMMVDRLDCGLRWF